MCSGCKNLDYSFKCIHCKITFNSGNCFDIDCKNSTNNNFIIHWMCQECWKQCDDTYKCDCN